MRFTATALALSVALLAAPAFAQSGGMTSGVNESNGHYGQSGQYGSNNEHNGYYRGSGQANTSSGMMNHRSNQSARNENGNHWNERGITYDTQQKIRQSLEQNGFHNVQVMPEAFVIHAQAPDGSHVVMQVSPDMVQGVIESTGSSSRKNEGLNQSGPSQNENWNSQSGTSGMNNNLNNR